MPTSTPLPRKTFDAETEFERYEGSFTRDELEQALVKSYNHVCRQVFAGKHAQDRDDANTWLLKWKPMVEALRRKRIPRVNTIEEDFIV